MASSFKFAYSNALLPSQPFHLLHIPSLNGSSSEASRHSNEPRNISTSSAFSGLQDTIVSICQAALTIFTPQPQPGSPRILPASPDYIDMSAASQFTIPATPGVIAPTPELSSVDTSSKANGYFSRRPATGPDPGERARTLDRAAETALRRRRTSQLASAGDALQDGASAKTVSSPDPDKIDGYLAPANAAGPGSKYSRHTFSRSPSPLGLIPIHRNWRKFVSCALACRDGDRDYRPLDGPSANTASFRYISMRYHANSFTSPSASSLYTSTLYHYLHLSCILFCSAFSYL